MGDSYGCSVCLPNHCYLRQDATFQEMAVYVPVYVTSKFITFFFFFLLYCEHNFYSPIKLSLSQSMSFPAFVPFSHCPSEEKTKQESVWMLGC